MKIIQLILRIITSPLVFGITVLAMIVFPGTMGLFLGGLGLIAKLLGVNIDYSLKELFGFTTMIVWVPFFNTYLWIKDAKFIE